MFSGLNEILLIAAIVLAVIFLPRINKPRMAAPARPRVPAVSGFALTGRQRLAILASIIWLAFWAVYYEPWGAEWKLFAYTSAPARYWSPGASGGPLRAVAAFRTINRL